MWDDGLEETMDVAGILDSGADDALWQTLNYWRSLCGKRRLPARKDFDPADIPRLLPKLMLADVSTPKAKSQAPQISFRLVGTEVVGRFGYELTGHHLSEIDYGARADDVADLYRRTVDSAQPQFELIDFQQNKGRHIRMQHLLLPLSDDGDRVNMILTVLHWQ